MRRAIRFLAYQVAAIAALLLMLEGLLALLAAHPPAWPPWRRAVADYYMEFERDIVQCDPACARYDPDLSYSLRPGRCRQSGREFDVEIAVNSAGLRDSEEALARPEVIVLGDSHAMGWGVRQDEAFPRLLGRATGLRTLNAAVPSYGTAREIISLRRLDTSALRCLVVQYCDNDADENRSFLRHVGFLPVMSRQAYGDLVAEQQRRRRYFPGKYLVRVPALLWTELAADDEGEPEDDPDRQAEMFLDVLRRTSVPLGDIPIIVLELKERPFNDAKFARALANRARKADDPLLRNIRLLDTSALLSKDDFYRLDEHMNALGHAKIAAALERLLADTGLRRRAPA